MGLRSRVVVYFVGVLTALVILVLKLHARLLPEKLAGQIGHNSEALLFALVVAALIHLYRRLGPTPLRLAVLLGLAAVLVALGVLVGESSLRPTLVTLNEPLIGSGLIAAYLSLPRSIVTGVLVSVLVLAVIVVLFDTSIVLDQAESLVPLMLAPLALDVFDRTILQPSLPDRPALRLLWVALLLALVLGSMVAARWARGDLHGPLRLGIDYSQRAAEAYWGWLLLHAYFSYWLGSRWRDKELL